MFIPWSVLLQATGPSGPAAPPNPAAWRAPVLWTTLVLVVVLLLGALVIALVDRLRKRSSSERLSPAEELAHYRSLYDRGELSREEFERIRALLSGRLRQELQLPGSAPPAAPQGAPPGPEPTPPEEGIRPVEPPPSEPPAG